MEKAQEADSNSKAIQFAQKALELDPTLTDAKLLILLRQTKDAAALQGGIEVLLKEEEAFLREMDITEKKDAGEYYLIFETRPYLRLCAAYIDKLNKYQDLVKRKVKAKQIDDLLKISSSKMSDSDARQFFVNFDTAFLTLYPNFISEFNSLVREGEEIIPAKGEILNTELRIFALIRLGIKDSSRIATLLFYSPQTIYNYRTSVKNKAKNRDEFEEQVKKLCPLM